MSLIANALKASRCVQIHAIVFSQLALRLSKIRRALLMEFQERIVKSQNWPDLYYRRIIRLGRAWEMNGNSSDNQSCLLYTSPSPRDA